MVPFRMALHGLILFAATASGLSQEYCSNENTGGDYAAVQNIYQSNGACYDQCKSSYAFAIVQDKSCWCSNYLPANQQAVGSCDQNCPGFPSDKCGNAAQGLYGYIALSGSPSGTAGGAVNTQPSQTQPSSSSTQQQSISSSTSSSPSQAPTSYVSQTVFQTVTQSQSASTVVSYVTPTLPSSISTTSVSTSSSTSSSSTIAPVVVPVAATTMISSIPTTATVTPTPVTSVRVVTLSGAIVTQTVTSTPSIAAASDPNDAQLQRKGLSGGAIAGAVIGCILGIAALILGACLLWRRKKPQTDAEVAAKRSIRSPRRNTSVLSRTGLLMRNRPTSMADNNVDEPMYVNTGNNSVRHSMLFGAGANAGDGVSPVSPLGSSHDNESNRRHSRPLVYDQRLNPSALFINSEGNGSRISIQDQQDYSRPLGVINPDPRASTDTRA